jgi:uncharacterized alkaline shock family protein YloU
MPRIPTGQTRDAAQNSAASAAPATESERVRWRGSIEVSQRAIATVAGRAVAECYGVVGIAAYRPRFTVVELLPPEHYSRGVVVRFDHDHVTIDLYVVLEYGLRITEIAHNIMASVRFAVEQSLGLRVVRVNVNVQALRVSGGERLGR